MSVPTVNGTTATVDGWDAVIVAPDALGSPTSWNFQVLSGGVTLAGSGSARTFTAPASFDGGTVQVGVTASNSDGTSPQALLTFQVKPWSSFILLGNGVWTPRRPFRVAPDNVITPVTGDVYDGGDPNNDIAQLYDGNGVNVIDGTGATDVLDGNGSGTDRVVLDGGTVTAPGSGVVDGNGGGITTPPDVPIIPPGFIDALGATNFIDALGATDLIDGSGF